MNIAVCLSGKPKFFERGYKFLEKNLLNNFSNVDLFLHCWSNNDEEKQKIIDLYKPKKFVFDIDKHFILNYPFKQSTSIPNNVFSMFYSIMLSNSLKKIYEKENNFIYDWVFRIRYDFALNKYFDNNLLHGLDNNYIYLNNYEINPNPHCADCFAFSNSKNMDIYSQVYNNIIKYGHSGVILAGEAMLYRQILENNVSIKQFDVNHAFQPDYITCFCKHSLIRN